MQFIFILLTLTLTVIGQVPIYSPSSQSNADEQLTYKELTMTIHCGTSPLADPSREAANYNPLDFARDVSRYGSALLVMMDRNVYGRCPWRVQVTDDQNNYLCAGVNIHDHKILTMASCIANLPLNKIRIRYGDYDLLNNENPHEAYQNYDSPVCHSSLIGLTSNISGQFALLHVPQAPDHDAYPQVKAMCLPQYNPMTPPFPNFLSDSNDSPCWIAGYSASPLIQIGNVASIIPRIAQVKRVSWRSLGGGQIEESWVGVNGYDSCVGDIGTPILCFVPDKLTSVVTSDSSTSSQVPSSLSQSQRKFLKLIPGQAKEDNFRAVVVGILKSPAKSCTVYQTTQTDGLESQPMTVLKVTTQTVNSILSLIRQNPEKCPI